MLCFSELIQATPIHISITKKKTRNLPEIGKFPGLFHFSILYKPIQKPSTRCKSSDYITNHTVHLHFSITDKYDIIKNFTFIKK